MKVCERCYQPLTVGEHGLYLCPLEPRRASAVWQDTIPGGLVIEHGICNEDGSPRTYYSRSEMTAACKARGMARWTDGYSEDRTRDARERIAWGQSGEAARLRRDNQERERDTKGARR